MKKMNAEVVQTSSEWMLPREIGVTAYGLSHGALMLVFSCETEGFMMEVRVDAEKTPPEEVFADLHRINGTHQ